MEQYANKPAKVEIFPLEGATDVILRRNIAKAEITEGMNGEESTTTCWQCEERQLRVPGAVSATEITADFNAWWDYSPAEPDAGITEADRLDALEAAVYDLAGVVYHG